MSTQHRFRLVLCGGGRIGTVHFYDLLQMPKIELVAIVDVYEPRAKELAAQANCKGFGTVEALFADTTVHIDGALICTTTATHATLVKQFLNKGIPVFCEKPVSLDIKEVDECYKLAKEKNLPLLCGFQRRFDPSFMKLKEHISQGHIGQLHVLRTTSRDHPLPSFEFLKTSGGIFHDCASHDIDVHRWLFGAEPVEVFATGHAFIPEIKAMDDFDAVVAVLKWPSGAMSTIDLHRNARYGYDQRIEAMGSLGMVEAHNKPKTTVVLSNDKGSLHDCINYTFNDRYPDAYKGEILHFVELVENKNVTLRVTHADVRNTGLIADACTESAKTGKPIIMKYD